MELGDLSRRTRFTSSEKLVAIGLALLAIVSPLYIDRRTVIDSGFDEQPTGLVSWLPLLLFVLIFAIIGSLYLERSFSKFDAHWIHRVGGSSGGILLTLLVLVLVLKCKASARNWEA